MSNDENIDIACLYSIKMVDVDHAQKKIKKNKIIVDIFNDTSSKTSLTMIYI